VAGSGASAYAAFHVLSMRVPVCRPWGPSERNVLLTLHEANESGKREW
jgi:hypothetical protein